MAVSRGMASLRTSLIAIFSRPLMLIPLRRSAPCLLGRNFSSHESTSPTSEKDKREREANAAHSESNHVSAGAADDDAPSSIPFLNDSCSPSYICDPGASHKTELHCAKECEEPAPHEEVAKSARPPAAP